jgi:hypothetical protein
MFVPSPDARFAVRADTCGRGKREVRAMGFMDLEVQRERRVEMLREAESKRAVGRRRRSGVVRKLVGFWIIGR